MREIKREKVWNQIYSGGENKETDDAIAGISEALGISELFAILLFNRGYRSAEEAARFLRFETADLHDPFLLRDMDAAVARIIKAVEDHEKIYIYGDYDVDGVTSVSLLYLYLKSKGADIGIKIPKRDSEGYGVSCAAIDAIAEQGTTLIITVDTGITANEEAKHAAERGIDMVITDHHECREELPQAVAVVNPHRPDCEYPFCELAGVGVVFKLVCACETEYCRRDGTPVIDGMRRICREYADLAAIGTVADVMPLADENRLIVSMGLRLIEKTGRKGLEALIKASATSSKSSQSDSQPPKKRKITSGFIGYGIAPRINAAGRISDAAIAVRLLLADNDEDAEKYAAELCDINRQRQVEENRIAEQAYAMIENNERFSSDKVIVLDDNGWQQGIIGIVSSRITEKYGLPSILISFAGSYDGEEHAEDIGKGSGRSIKGMNLVSALSNCEDKLLKFGGHELAAGLTIKRGDIEGFREKINEYARKNLPDDVFRISLNADCELQIGDITLEFAEEIQALEPFGVGNPAPSFIMREVTVARVMQIGGGKHTKLVLGKDGSTVVGMYFGMTAADLGFDAGDSIDLLFTLDINDFRNVRSVQVIIQDARLSESVSRIIEDDKLRYEQVHAGDSFSEAENFIPDRSDFAEVYKVLRREFRAGSNVIDIKTLIKLVNSSDHEKINYVKLRYIIRIINELKICSIEEIGEDIYRFEVIFNASKTSIDKSSILKKLKSQCTDRTKY